MLSKVSATVLLPAATLSVTVNAPVRELVAVGAKVIEIVQLIIADNAAGQLLTWESGSLTISENGPGNGGKSRVIATPFYSWP